MVEHKKDCVYLNFNKSIYLRYIKTCLKYRLMGALNVIVQEQVGRDKHSRWPAHAGGAARWPSPRVCLPCAPDVPAVPFLQRHMQDRAVRPISDPLHTQYPGLTE